MPGLLVVLGGLGSFLLGDGPLLYAALLVLGFASWFYLPVLFTIPLELPGASETRVALTYGTMMTIASFFRFPVAVIRRKQARIYWGRTRLDLRFLPCWRSPCSAGGIVLPETGSDREPAARSGA